MKDAIDNQSLNVHAVAANDAFSETDHASAIAHELLEGLWGSSAGFGYVGVVDRALRFDAYPAADVDAALLISEQHAAKGRLTYFSCTRFENANGPTDKDALPPMALWLDLNLGRGHGQKNVPIRDIAKTVMRVFQNETALPLPSRVVVRGDSMMLIYLFADLVPIERWHAVARMAKVIVQAHFPGIVGSRTADVSGFVQLPLQPSAGKWPAAEFLDQFAGAPMESTTLFAEIESHYNWLFPDGQWVPSEIVRDLMVRRRKVEPETGRFLRMD